MRRDGTHSFSAVTDGIFLTWAKLAKGELESGGQEDGVIAKALGSTRWPDNLAFHHAFKGFAMPVGPT